jgi:hypothetical protein
MWRVLSVLAVCAAPAAKAEGEIDVLPNPLRNQNLAATCNTMGAQVRAADPQAMAIIAGVWEGVTPVPGVQGLYPDTQSQFRVINNPDGSFQIDLYTCFEPYGQVPACANGLRYGEWNAHYTDDGWIAVPALSAGSSHTGEALPVSCGIGFWRQDGPNVLVDQQGTRMGRAGG